MSNRQPAAEGAAKAPRKSMETPEVPTAKSGMRPADWPKELGGPEGPEPTRYGDWEQKGRCTDF